MRGRQAFWSYVHHDDDDEGGRISDLAHLLRKRIRLLTGAEFQIFLDRESLGWGDDWESRINEALLQTTFFIPLVTPSYFQSEECRRELLKFASVARALGLEELILPIYYVGVPEIEKPSGVARDELIQLVQRFQWQDWRQTALEEPQSSVHRKAVDELAKQLINRADQADAKPTDESASRREAPSSGLPAPGPKAGPKEDSGAGAVQAVEEQDRIGVLAAGEQAMPRLNEHLQAIVPLLGEIGEITDQATKDLAQSDARGGGFGGRLVVTRRFAEKLHDPASKLDVEVANYLEQLLAVDQTIMLLLQILTENPSQIGGSAEFLDVVVDMADKADEGLAGSETLAAVLGDNAKWSKDLRAPSQQIERALRQMADTRSIFQTWKSEITELRQQADDG
jgi:hypothetical protein